MYGQYAPDREALLTVRNKQYIKEFLGKPFTLVTAIIILATAILDNLCSILNAIGIFPLIPKLNELLDSTEYGESSNISISANVGLPITTILLLVSFALLYFKSRKKNDTSTPTAGATLFQVWSVVSLIGDLLVALLLVLLPVLIFVGIDFLNTHTGEPAVNAIKELLPLPSDGLGLNFVGIILSIDFILIAALFIIMGISRLKFASSLKKNLANGTFSTKGTVPFVICNIFYAMFAMHNALCLLPSAILSDDHLVTGYSQIDELFAEVSLPFINITAIISLVLSAVIPLCLAKFALRYRKHIKNAGEDGCNLPEPEIPVFPEEYTPLPEAEATPASETVEATQEAEEAPFIPDIPTEEVPPVSQDGSAEENPYSNLLTPAEPSVPIDPAAPEEEPPAPQLSAPKFCCMCGVPVTPEQKFCAHCGSKLC